MTLAVAHRTLDLDGTRIFYREAGPADAPAILLPHGYPCSSYAFRDLLPRLADRWRLLAPDFPGCGYSATPDTFDYSFDGYARMLGAFADQLGVDRFALYLHDFGSQIGLRLAISEPSRIAALIIQNGDIYEAALGPKYAALKALWQLPQAEAVARIRAGITRDEFRREFLNEVDPDTAQRISPDLWELH